MKIAMYYTRPFETGGVEKTMYSRGKYLKSQGHEITYIYASNDSPLDMLEKWSTIGNVRHIDTCKEEIFDWVIYDAVYNLKKVKARNNNYIQVINGCLIDSCENYEEVIPFKKYVAVSEEAKKQFKERKGKDCVVIPNMINSDEIRRLSEEKVDISKKKHNFLIVSRIDPQKGFPRLRPILDKCKEKYGDDYQFVVVGSCYLYPQYSEKLKKELQDYNVIWLGKQDNPYKYMKWADSLWQLSDYESQCMVMYESLIIGTPCVCTDFPNAVKELVDDKGFVLKKDLSNLDLEKIEKLKKGFEYEYSDYGKEWLEILEPPIKHDYKFSIIIPNYNNAKWLEKCLNSVLSQTYTNYEIIFIDDMSEDNSLEIANRMLKLPHKVLKVPYKKYNGGTRNIGIMEATGDYIVCIDSDDWLKNENVLKDINDNLNDEDVMFLGFELGKDGKEDLFPFRPFYENMYQAFTNDVCAVWTKVIKTDLLKDTLFPESTLAEDRVHHYRICDKAQSFTCLNQSTHVWNRSNATSVTTKREAMWEMSIYKHLGEMYYFIMTTKNDKYREYVKNKFNFQWKELEAKRFQQI
jgi:glycosyltransferase involved in cell wall biosynthesis